METAPPRAEILFAEAELRAERTVGLLRMLIAVALAVVFAAAVLGTPTAEQAMLERQWRLAGGAMLAYFMLGLGAWIALRRGADACWVSWTGATADVAFLLANLWLALDNTGLAANYLVCLPPIFLAPLTLAFGALRFNPALQIYFLVLLVAGLAGIAAFGGGWAFEPAEPPPAVLNLFMSTPPYIMRLAMLFLAGAVLVVAALRARALLRRAIREAERGANLTRYLPRQVAARLAETGLEELRRGRRQNVAILFVDVREFTAMSETMTPEALGAFLTEFRRRVARSVDATGGVIDKFIGDAAMVVFGLDRPDATAAAAALACADLLLADVADRRPDDARALHISIGAHWGEVFSGAIGDEARLEFTVIGDAVNVAARLQELAADNDLPALASGAILAAAGESAGADWRKLEISSLRGRLGSVDVYGRAPA